MLTSTLRAIAILAITAALAAPTGCAGVRPHPETDGPSIVARELIKSSHSWDGALLPAYPQGQPEITILRIQIPAGARLHTHHHPVINAGVLICGQLTVVSEDGDTLHLNAGDPIVELVETSHYGFNPGDTPAEIIVFYAGGGGGPITVIDPQ